MEMNSGMESEMGGGMAAPAPTSNKVCVEIELDTTTGQASVGICPPEQEAGEKGFMQNAGTIDKALAAARQILIGAMQGQAARAATAAAPVPQPGQAAFR